MTSKYKTKPGKHYTSCTGLRSSLNSKICSKTLQKIYTGAFCGEPKHHLLTHSPPGFPGKTHWVALSPGTFFSAADLALLGVLNEILVRAPNAFGEWEGRTFFFLATRPRHCLKMLRNRHSFGGQTQPQELSVGCERKTR